MNRILTYLTIFLSVLGYEYADAAKHYAGGDISLLPEYEEAGAIYKTHEGQVINNLLPWLHEQGMNAMRVRLFVNPDLYAQRYADSSNSDLKADPNACQDLEYILPLCKRIVDNGFALMLDFHYSDTWADPAKQWIPLDWKGQSTDQLAETIYDYTRETLITLRENGIEPAFIQTGNEISYGMMWGQPGSVTDKIYPSSSKGWNRFISLLKAAGRACREICPDAGIVIHTERSGSTTELIQFYNRIEESELDYDIIGLSYYPYFHGGMDSLDKSLSELENLIPGRQIMIVETGYAYKWEVPGTTHDFTGTWKYSDAGQNQYAKDLVATLEKHQNVTGLFWWWLEYNAYGTSLSGWYNAPLFDSTNGRATSALRTICTFATNSAITEIPSDIFYDRWYDLQGRPVTEPSAPGLYISPKGKHLK